MDAAAVAAITDSMDSLGTPAIDLKGIAGTVIGPTVLGIARVINQELKVVPSFAHPLFRRRQLTPRNAAMSASGKRSHSPSAVIH